MEPVQAFLQPAEVLACLAENALIRQQFEDAFRLAEEALELDGNSPRALYVRGECHRHRATLDAAIVDLTTALIFLPDQPEILASRAACQIMSAPLEALEDVNQCLKIKPDHQWGLLIRAKVHLQLKQLDAAKIDLLALIARADDRNPEISFLWAKHCYLTRSFELALKYLGRVIELEPDHRDALILTANIMAEGQDYPAAVNALTLALKHRSSDSELWLKRGMILRNLDRLAEAIADLTMCLTLNPTNLEALFTRGDILRQAGDLEGAKHDIEILLKLDPKHGKGYLCRAAIRASQGETEEARGDLYLARKYLPANLKLPDGLLAIFQQGQP
jgi:tetratricopeptide (TPR) repeat protein